MVNTLTKGQATVGRMYGGVGAGAGSIGSTEIVAGAILSTLIGVGEVMTTNILAGEILTTHISPGEIRRANIGVGEILTTHITAGEIETALLGSLAVGTTDIAADAVTSIKLSMGWSTLSNTTKSVSAITLPAANRGYVITEVGASLGTVITSTAGLDSPTAGDHYSFLVDTVASTKPIHFKSATATFNAGGDKVIGLEAAGQYFSIEALSTIRWIVTERSSGLNFSAAT